MNFDSARRSQIEAKRSDRRGPAQSGQCEEEDRFGKVAASQNSQNLTARGMAQTTTKIKIMIRLIFLHALIALCFTFHFVLQTKEIETFYGTLQVEEPILLELIESPAFQRLKNIHQYGVAYFTTHRENYTRYDHSLGVFAILRAQNVPLKDQIAGLLHDVSHTVFSHVGDWIFGKENQEEDYQNSIHAHFLKQSNLEDILQKYGFTAEQMAPTHENFPALECPLPDLSADRIDYNIQGAYYQGFITYEEAKTIFKELQYANGIWIIKNYELLKKLVRSSLFLTQTCWGSATNYLSCRWLADAILRAIDLKCISFDDLHFGSDEVIWERLVHHEDPEIQKKMKMVAQTTSYYSYVAPECADLIVKSRFRGIDPLVVSEGTIVRLTSIDPILAQDYQLAKQRIETGWALRMHDSF